MKLKYRLVLSFVILVFLPVVLMTLLFFTYGRGDGVSLGDYIHSFVISSQTQVSLSDIIFSFLAVLILTAAIFVIWIYRGIISKIDRLIYGANNIKEGNLNFTIATEGTDEMSELINTFEDMKERLRRDSEEKLIAENEQRELISNIAHDLKTPLTAIRGYAEGLLDGVADTDEKREAYIRTISKKADDLNILLNELTTYSNISTNRIPYNFNHINVKKYFSDILEEYSIDFDTMYGSMEYTIDVRDDVEMIADPEQLHRVIENLVGNSVKYKGDKPLQVTFRIKEIDGFIQIEMQDNGKGIKNEDIPYIFDRTYRGDASRQPGVGGSGLGLSIARKIIEDHGGKIWATSQIDKGSCFYMIIRQYTLSNQEEDSDEQNTDNRRRRGNSRARERLSRDKRLSSRSDK